ncbi:MAG: dockerin type I repeat-containing protein [Planctomycetota bacterium]|jgi:hypothetical protein
MKALFLRAMSILPLLVLTPVLTAQDPDLHFTLGGPDQVAGGSSFQVGVMLDNGSTSAHVAGWQTGVCHDPALLQLDLVADGGFTQIAKNGSPADFTTKSVYLGGFTAGTVIDFFGAVTVAPGSMGLELFTADYTALVSPVEPAPGVSTQIAFCNTQGVPPVANVVTVASVSITPTQVNRTIEIPAAADVDPSYLVRIDTPASVLTGAPLTAGIRLDNTGSALAGWQLGVCLDTTVLQIDGLGLAADAQALLDSASLTGFSSNIVHPNGVSSAAVIDFGGVTTLPAGSLDFGLADIALTAIADPGLGNTISTTLNFCETLGSPPISNVVTVGTTSVTPDQQGATLVVDALPPPPPATFTFSVDPIDPVTYSPSSPISAPFEASIRAEQDSAGQAPTEASGFSMGLAHDSARLSIGAVSPGAALLALGGGNGPSVFMPAIHANGWTLGVVFDTLMTETLTFSASAEVAVASYSLVSASLVGVSTPSTTPLTWSNAIGATPVLNLVVLADSSSSDPILVDGVVLLEPIPAGSFIRGDTNGDGTVNLPDAIFLLATLFAGGPSTAGTCPGANDVNSDGLIHLADAIYLLNHLFAAGAAPNAPFPACGSLTDVDCDDPGLCTP